MFLYIWALCVLGLICSLLLGWGCSRLYYKVKYPFWSIQPVFHIYDVKYWIYLWYSNMIGRDQRRQDHYMRRFNIMDDPFVIEPSIRSLHSNRLYYKYLDELNIKSFVEDSTNIISNELKTQTTEFIQSHFLSNSFIQYKPTEPDIYDYLHPSSIISISNNQITNEMNGFISARPLHITFKTSQKYTPYSFLLHYVDNLCVHKHQRKKGIAPKLIQTHYAHLRKTYPSLPVCLFKKEGEMTPIVPLTTYTTTGYSIQSIMNLTSSTHSQSQSQLQLNSPNTYVIPLEYTLLRITTIPGHLQLFREYIKQSASLNEFECVIHPPFETIVHLIKQQHFMIYGLFHKQTTQLHALYVYRKLPTHIKNQNIDMDTNIKNETNMNSTSNWNCIELVLSHSLIPLLNINQSSFISSVSSISNIETNVNSELFISAFYSSLRRIKRKIKHVHYLFMDTTCKSTTIINHLKENNIQHVHSSPTAFFLYNYLHYSIPSHKCFFIF
jgi:ribosomal protein S18 acetylase RimI-like enzyme